MSNTLSELGSSYLCDSSGPWVVRPGDGRTGHLVRIENFGIPVESRTSDDGSLRRLHYAIRLVQQVFNDRGLLIHELEMFPDGGPTLGIELDGRALCVRSAWERYVLLRRAVRALLQLRSVNGHVLGILIGHCTYFGLVRRSLMIRPPRRPRQPRLRREPR